MSINTSDSFLETVIKIGNICFMLERKSFDDLPNFEVFDDILFD